MIPVTVHGHTYKSISAAWRDLSPDDLPMITVRWRLKDGWRPEDAFLLDPVPAQDRRSFKEMRA